MLKKKQKNSQTKIMQKREREKSEDNVVAKTREREPSWLRAVGASNVRAKE